MTDDPARWSDGAGDPPTGLQDALADLQQIGPTPKELEALVASVTAAVPGGEGGPGGDGGGLAGKTGLSAKLALGAAAIAVVGGVFWVVNDDRDPRGDQPAAAELQSAAVEPGPHQAPPPVETEVVERDEEERAAADVEQQRVGRPSDERAVARRGAPTRARRHESRADETREAGEQEAQREAVTSAEPGLDEMTLLARARRSLSSAPAETLRLTETHLERFPGSNYVEEREVLAIQALLRLGRAEAGERRGRRFLRAHPSSIHSATIESLLSDH